MSKSLITTKPETDLETVLRVMLENGIHRIPVLDNNESTSANKLVNRFLIPVELVGILSERDLRMAIDSTFLPKAQKEKIDALKKHKVEEIMTRAVVTVEAQSPIVRKRISYY
jgi:acetoin utilization protein AcuB